MNLAFLNILEETRHDAELNLLLDIGACDFNNFRNMVEKQIIRVLRNF